MHLKCKDNLGHVLKASFVSNVIVLCPNVIVPQLKGNYSIYILDMLFHYNAEEALKLAIHGKTSLIQSHRLNKRSHLILTHPC